MDKDERLHQNSNCGVCSEGRAQRSGIVPGNVSWQCPGVFCSESVVSFSFPEKKSYFLWEYHEGHETSAWVLCCWILWTGFSLFPAGKDPSTPNFWNAGDPKNRNFCRASKKIWCQTPSPFSGTDRSKSQECFGAFQCLQRDKSEMKFCVLPAWVESGCYKRVFGWLISSSVDLNRIYLLFLCSLWIVTVAARKCSACEEFIPLLSSLNQPNFQARDHFSDQGKLVPRRRIKVQRCFLCEAAAEHCWTCVEERNDSDPGSARLKIFLLFKIQGHFTFLDWSCLKFWPSGEAKLNKREKC